MCEPDGPAGDTTVVPLKHDSAAAPRPTGGQEADGSDHEDRPGRDIVIAPLVTMIAHEPGMARRMLDEHVDDGRGRCAGCRWHDRPQPRFPCTLQVHAQAAARLRP